jgi:hypothetical protein
MSTGEVAGLNSINGIIWVFLPFRSRIDSAIAGREEAKNLAGKILA